MTGFIVNFDRLMTDRKPMDVLHTNICFLFQYWNHDVFLTKVFFINVIVPSTDFVFASLRTVVL